MKTHKTNGIDESFQRDGDSLNHSKLSAGINIANDGGKSPSLRGESRQVSIGKHTPISDNY